MPLYAITNYSAEKWAETSARFPFLAHRFRDTVVSGREGVTQARRPQSSACSSTATASTPPPASSSTTTRANVAAAAALGIDAIHFTTPEALRDALVARGLLTARTETA